MHENNLNYYNALNYIGVSCFPAFPKYNNKVINCDLLLYSFFKPSIKIDITT